MAIFLPIGFILLNVHARSRGVEAIRALHRAGLCPSCGYDLKQIEPADDGCALCPECGAAWRRS